MEFKPSKIILALDVDSKEKAFSLLEKVGKKVAAVKLHPEHSLLWGISHAELTAKIKELSENAPVILDAKLADIDSSNAMKSKYYFANGYDAIICHAFPGEKAVKAIVDEANGKGVFVVCAMTSPGHAFTPDLAEKFAFLAYNAGVTGLVAPGNQYDLLKKIRDAAGPELVIISPGIGFQGGEAKKAIDAGADYAIVGRAIVEAEDPEKAFEELQKQLE